MAYPKPGVLRTAAMVDELTKAADDYDAARAEFELRRQKFEVSKERFIGIRRLAADVMSSTDFYEWERAHRHLKMVGLDLKDAILTVLRYHAIDSADEAITSKGKKRFDPSMYTASIVDELDSYGFAFRTATPRREVHAALLHLKGTKKVGTMRYAIDGADNILKEMMDAYGVKELGEVSPTAEVPKPVEEPPPPPDDESYWETDQEVPQPEEDNVPF